MYNYFVKNLKQKKYFWSKLKTLLTIKLCVFIPSFITFKLLIYSSGIPQIILLLLLVQITIIFFYGYMTNSSLTIICTFIISVCLSQCITILVMYYWNNTPIILLIFAFTCFVLFGFLLYKTNIISKIVTVVTNELILTAIGFTLLGLLIKFTLALSFSEEFTTLLNATPLAVQTVADVGVTFPLIHLMGNSGSRGLGVVTSTASHISHASTTGGGKPIHYTEEFLKEFQRRIGIYSMKDPTFKEDLEHTHPLSHMIAVNDDKTIGNTLTTSPNNSTPIAKETVYPQTNKKKEQYMYNEPIGMTEEFIDENMTETPEQKEYALNHKDELEYVQETLYDDHKKKNPDKPIKFIEDIYQDALNKKKNNMFELFMFYCNQQKIKESGIYRFKFQTREVSYVEIYSTIINMFIPSRNYSDIRKMTSKYIDAIFIVKTSNNIYYCNFFMKDFDNRVELILFERWLKLHKIKFNLYIENKLNTERYQDAVDVGLFGIYDSIDLSVFKYPFDLPRYSYWNWIYDILTSEIENYILLDAMSLEGEKNIYLKRNYLLDFIKLSNFYYLNFENCPNCVTSTNFEEIIAKWKEKTLEIEIAQYQELTNAVDLFNDYWSYLPHVESYFPINYIGLIDASLRYNFKILHADVAIEDQKTTVENIFQLFNVKLVKPEIEAVIMFKPKNNTKYKIIFVVNKIYEKIEHDLLSLIREFDASSILEKLITLHYNFYKKNPQDYKSRSVNIEINSLVIGLYTKNTQYWKVFSSNFGDNFTGLYSTDHIQSQTCSPGYFSYCQTDHDNKFLLKYQGIIFRH